MKLEKLKNKIKRTWKDAWFFDDYFEWLPKNSSIGGFLSAGKYFFIFPNPNKREGNINEKNWALDKFFKMLKNLKIRNAHLTDFTKIPLIKEKAREYWSDKKKFCLPEQFLKREIEILENEINIIKPLKIIIVGKSYKNYIQPIIKKITKNKIKIDWIYHYACREPNKWKKIENKLNEIIKEN